MADLVHAHYYITDPAYMDTVFPTLGDTCPAATKIVFQLNKPEMRIKIEVAALKRAFHQENRLYILSLND